jgi:hypothetical protein
MSLPKQALNLFLAATLVFVNLACACASASVSVSDSDQQLGQHQSEHQHQHQQNQNQQNQNQQHQHDQHGQHDAVVETQHVCSHQFTDSQCPDCSSDVAISCDNGALTLQLAKLNHLGQSDDSGQALVISQVPYLPLPVPISTGPPVQPMVFIADSPVRRHDRQLI